jgi:hypothetical protein
MAPVLRMYGVLIQNPEPCWVVNCSEVRETAFADLLQLVPAAESRPLTLFVPARNVLWMLRAETESQLGFLAGWTQAPPPAAPQSDPTG